MLVTGAVVGVVEAGKDRLGADIEGVERERAARQGQVHGVAVDFEGAAVQIALGLGVDHLGVADVEVGQDEGELGAVEAVDVAAVARVDEQAMGEGLHHAVAEGIAVEVVDRGEMGEADGEQDRVLVLVDQALQVLEIAVLVLQAGGRVHVAREAVLADRAGEVGKVALRVVHDNAAAGAGHVVAGDGPGAVLHVVRGVRAVKQGDAAVVEDLAVVGVEALLPEVARLGHIFAGQAEALDCRAGPAGDVVLHVADVGVGAVGHEGKRGEELVKHVAAHGRHVVCGHAAGSCPRVVVRHRVTTAINYHVGGRICSLFFRVWTRPSANGQTAPCGSVALSIGRVSARDARLSDRQIGLTDGGRGLWRTA